METYRIGEFAKQHGVSVQLLRYYDQHDILHPILKDETGRYYADYQSIRLMEYRYLSRMGLSLSEAQKLLTNGSLADWCDHLSCSHSVIKNEIMERQILIQFIDELCENLRQIQQKASWRIEPWDGGWFMSEEQSAAYPWGREGEPLLQTWQRVILTDHSNANDVHSHWGTLLPKDFPHDTTGLDAVSGGLCFVYAHSLQRCGEFSSSRLSNQAVDFRDPLKIVADNGLKPRGDLYQRWLCETHDDKGIWTQVLTRIPLQQNFGTSDG